MRIGFEWIPRAALMVAALGLAGCGDGRPKEPVYSAKGQVFYKGKPAAGAVIWFHRVSADEVDPKKPASRMPSRGVVQSDGSFEMSTYGTNDGVPVGRYRLSVRWAKAKGGGDNEENLLPERYMDPKTAGLPVVEVKSEPNVLARLDLVP